MRGVSEVTMSNPTTFREQAKAVSAAQDFEGVLLSSLLEQFQASFQIPGGEERDAGGESIRGLGMQELGNFWAKSGGIGVAGLISRHIGQSSVEESKVVKLRPLPADIQLEQLTNEEP